MQDFARKVEPRLSGGIGIAEGTGKDAVGGQAKTVDAANKNPPPAFQSPGLFSDEELILDEILSTDTDRLPPIEALLKIARWKKALSPQ